MIDSIYQYFDSVGDGSGTKNMATAADTYYVTAPATQAYVINRSLWHIVDTGAFAVATFGAATALATGISVKLFDEDLVEKYDYTNGVPFKNNGDMSRTMYDIRYDSFGVGDNALSGRWTFANSGKPIKIPPSWSLGIVVPDSLADLTEMYVMAQGWVR